MRERLQGKGLILVMSGGALLIAVVLIVLWGLPTRPGWPTSTSDTTTTTVVALASDKTTTTTIVDPDNGADPNAPEPGGTTSTTTPSDSGGSGGNSGGSSGSGGGSSTTAPPNQAPIIVDPGLSSKGLTLAITPTITDPEGDDVDVTLTVNGEDTAVNAGTASTTFPLSEVGYSHNATIEIRAADTAGNETVEAFSHMVEAVTTVVVSDVTFRLQSPSLCFEDTAAVQFDGSISVNGTINKSLSFGVELRPDLTEVGFLHAGATAVGRPGAVDVAMFGDIGGVLDTYQDSHNSSDTGFAQMFKESPCRGYFSYKVEITTE